MTEPGQYRRSVMSNRAPRRHSAAQQLVLFVNCLLVVGCLGGATALVVGQQLLDDASSRPRSSTSPNADDAELGPAETFPKADPEAKNFLITGSDNNACVDPGVAVSPARSAIAARSANAATRSW